MLCVSADESCRGKAGACRWRMWWVKTPLRPTSPAWGAIQALWVGSSIWGWAPGVCIHSSMGSLPGAIPTQGCLCLLQHLPAPHKGARPLKVLVDGPWLSGRWERSPEPGWPMFPAVLVSVADALLVGDPASAGGLD